MRKQSCKSIVKCLFSMSSPCGLNSLMASLTLVTKLAFNLFEQTYSFQDVHFVSTFPPFTFWCLFFLNKGHNLLSCKICLCFSEINMILPKSENNNSIWLNSNDLQKEKKKAQTVKTVMICRNLQEALVLGPGVLLLTITQIVFLCNYPSNNQQQAKIIEA